MSLLPVLRLFRITERIIIPTQYTIQVQHYAAPMKKTTKAVKIELPVEKDVNKILTYACGSNIYKDGEDVKLKPDSEYPDWLWTIRTEPRRLEDLDPNTKDYWRYVRRHALQRNNKLRKYRKF